MAESKKKASSGLVIRETVESFAVALILAFMFRAFVAEIFVIPTGSMAPTLMGAHKDVTSPESTFGYQCGSSLEFDSNSGKLSGATTVGTTCPLSRKTQLLDLNKDPNDTTFSGDRIIVSKFSYLWNDPKRWDVIVFKNPYKAEQNYIKRCVGLPNETLRIEQGDIFVRPEKGNAFTAARKSPSVIEATLQPIADTNFPQSSAVKAGVPSAWQPYKDINEGNLGWDSAKADEAFDNGWKIENQAESWKATYSNDDTKAGTAWLRYHHRVLSGVQWDAIEKTDKLPGPIARYSSKLITDFVAYNAATIKPRDKVYDERGKIRESYRDNWSSAFPQAGGFTVSYGDESSKFENDGRHWTGDLATEFDLKLGKAESDAKLTLDLVEAGVHYLCEVNLQDGKAKLTAVEDGNELSVFEAESGTQPSATASTTIRAGRSCRVKYANVDDSLTLWVDGSVVSFAPSNRIVGEVDAAMTEHRPKSTEQDPLDAAPIGIGIQGAALTVNRARAWRDIYYIAAGAGQNIVDDPELAFHIGKSMNAGIVSEYLQRVYPGIRNDILAGRVAYQRDVLYSSPQLWKDSPVFGTRHKIEYVLGNDEYFPMGDNSAASADARGWAQPLPRSLLIGRAVSVFWPHVWMAPIPYLPNIGRIGLIR